MLQKIVAVITISFFCTVQFFGFIEGNEALKCFSSKSSVFQSSNLPAKIGINTCRPGQTCIKVQIVTVANQDGVEKLVNTSYRWGCADLRQYYVNCAEQYEVTVGTKYPFTYIRICSCCGELCNGQQMDGDCNEKPEFKVRCFAAESVKKSSLASPKLPSNASEMPCTRGQACVKMSSFVNSSAYYQWGCNTPPRGACGFSGIGDDGNKICTCCGDRCNGAPAMDSVLANNSLCLNFLKRSTEKPVKSSRPSWWGNTNSGHALITLPTPMFTLLMIGMLNCLI